MENNNTNNNKEKLEQELRFLKESFDAEVISRDEFEKGKDRIEKKLQEIESPADVQDKEEKQSAEKQESENSKAAGLGSKEDEKINLNVIQDGSDEAYFEPEPNEENVQKSETKTEANSSTSIPYEKKESKFFKYAVVFVVLSLVVFFSYSLIKPNKAAEAKSNGVKFVPSFAEEAKTNVLVLNDKENCFNCNTERVLGILESWFGAANVKNIEYNTNEGKNLADMLDLKSMPVYILDENITKNPAFEQFSQAFVKKGNYYILKDDAAGSTFYFRRENIPNKLDFFAKADDSASIKSENNLKEFLDNFKNISFEKHLSNDKLAEEIGIRAFPSFLINNRIKFSGVQPAETIKENYCALNKVDECKKSLSRSLV